MKTLQNQYTYNITLCDFSQHLLNQKLLIVQNELFKEFNCFVFINISTSFRKKKKFFTILKGPFVHKKAREQFFIEFYSVTLTIHFFFKLSKTLNSYLFSKLFLLFKKYNITYLNFYFSLKSNKLI